jgi:glyoxylase-like metal-dependent hydrolase (beta-lactamase superfamily II)
MSGAGILPPSMRVLERGWLSSNNVLLFDEDGQATLVDTGYVTHSDQTLALVRHALDGRRLARIVNTHLHSDHCGGNAALKRAFGATLHIPPGHADAVTRWDEDELTFRATGQQCERFVHDGVIAPGSALRMGDFEWLAYPAPGHDPHSLVLWAAQPAILISADALWSNGFGVIFPELEGESGFAEQRAMLGLIEKLAPRLVIPGHGAPFSDVGAALGRAHARLDALSASLERNARHAAKVLLKFYLLEVREVAMHALVSHAAGARYYRLINDRYFRMPFEAFVRQQVRALVASGAAVLDGDTVRDVDG